MVVASELVGNRQEAFLVDLDAGLLSPCHLCTALLLPPLHPATSALHCCCHLCIRHCCCPLLTGCCCCQGTVELPLSDFDKLPPTSFIDTLTRKLDQLIKPATTYADLAFQPDTPTGCLADAFSPLSTSVRKVLGQQVCALLANFRDYFVSREGSDERRRHVHDKAQFYKDRVAVMEASAGYSSDDIKKFARFFHTFTNSQVSFTLLCSRRAEFLSSAAGIIGLFAFVL